MQLGFNSYEKLQTFISEYVLGNCEVSYRVRVIAREGVTLYSNFTGGSEEDILWLEDLSEISI